VPSIRALIDQSSSENASNGAGDRSPGPTSRALRSEDGSVGNWLMHYARYTHGTESPESYHLWTGLSVLASAVRRNVFLNQGKYVLYPNLYVILIGPAGKMAKSTTIRLGRALLYGVEGIKFSPDAVTSEELSKIIEKSHDGKQSAVTIHSTELSDLIDPSGIKMISFLTTIYDSDPSGWKRGTKTAGYDDIKSPVLNLLGGTTPDWIANGLPVDAIGHGFTSRIIFIHEDIVDAPVPFPEEADRELVENLISDLDYISRIEGEFTWDMGIGPQPDGGPQFEGWEPEYNKAGMIVNLEGNDWRIGSKYVYAYFYRKIFGSKPKDYRVEGYHWRKRNHLLKVAMLVSIAESDELVLRSRDIIAAWTLLEGIESKMVRAFSSVGKYEHASDLERILSDIQDSGGMTREEILTRNYAAGDENELSRILSMLVKMRKIERMVDQSNGVWYKPV
jgi:hypothetical protein